MSDPLRLSQLECIFGTDAGIAKIRSTGWGDFERPVFLPHKVVGMSAIDLNKIDIDIVPAADAIHLAGIDLAFWNVALEHPLVAPGKVHEEPYYVFLLVDGSYIFVGAKDKDVIFNHAGEKTFLNTETSG